MVVMVVSRGIVATVVSGKVPMEVWGMVSTVVVVVVPRGTVAMVISGAVFAEVFPSKNRNQIDLKLFISVPPMSYDLFLLEGSFFRSPSSEILPSDVELQQLQSDPFLPFPDPSSSSTEILHGFSDQLNHYNQFPAETELCGSADQTAINLFSCSSPSQKLSNLSLEPESQSTQLSSADGLTGFSVLDMDTFGLISEDCFGNLESSSSSSLLPNDYSYSDAQKNTNGMIQRSFSSQSLDQKPDFSYHPHISSSMESQKFPIQVMGLSENTNFAGPMRRICSTGDLKRMTRTHLNNGYSSSPLAVDSSFAEETSFKVGRYSPEERKLRIHRYRSKRTQRNFNKTIKYACRKTLADSRPRVRGRFARNEDPGEIPKLSGLNREDEDEDDFWVDRFQEENEDAMIRGAIGGGGGGGAGFDGSFNPTKFQYCGF
ncbi:hypothetical protein NE237_013613 [Protea cynaroides]|uniref:CCT domain-containing protein n=1 Tax=Protea cynaroides TaxID=273540 RepID=A0A9Q0H2E3_9MAGN|nr:hypothetical protein NE237_013613 [Protea cynaroides]